jgi:outer membrane protein assembly factor BamB
MNFRRSFSVAVTCLGFWAATAWGTSPSVGPADTLPSAELLWTHHLDKEVDWFQVSALGDLIVGTKDGVTALDPTSGEVTWSRPGEGAGKSRHAPAGGAGHPAEAAWKWAVDEPFPERVPPGDILLPQEIGNAGYLEWFLPDRQALVGLAREDRELVIVDPVTGSEQWRLNRAAWQAQPTLIDCSHAGLLLLAGVARDGTPRVTAFDWGEGAPRWTRDDLLGGGSHDPRPVAQHGALRGAMILSDTDSTIVLWSTDGSASRIDLATGRSIWTRADFAATYPAAMWNTTSAIAVSDLVVVTEGAGAVALDATTGAERWRRARLFPPMDGVIRSLYRSVPKQALREVSLQSAPSCILAIGPLETYIMALDPGTGAPLWAEPNHSIREKLGFAIAGDDIYAADTDSLYVIDDRSGDERSITPVTFGEDERPLHVDARDEGVLLQSWRRVVFVDYSGAVRYEHAFDGGSTPRGAGPKGFLGILAEGALVGSAVLDLGATAGAWYHPEASSDLYDLHWTLSALAATPSSEDAPHQRERFGFARVTQEDPRGKARPCVLRFDPVQGRELGVVWLRKPDAPVRIDTWFQRVFVQTSKDEIEAYAY